MTVAVARFFGYVPVPVLVSVLVPEPEPVAVAVPALSLSLSLSNSSSAVLSNMAILLGPVGHSEGGGIKLVSDVCVTERKYIIYSRFGCISI